MVDTGLSTANTRIHEDICNQGTANHPFKVITWLQLLGGPIPEIAVLGIPTLLVLFSRMLTMEK